MKDIGRLFSPYTAIIVSLKNSFIMAKRHYKTLKGLLSQTLYGRIDFVDFHWNKFYHKKNGWMNFTLPDEEMNRCYRLMAAAIYSRSYDSKAYLMKNYHGNAHGILTSIIVGLSKKNGLQSDFCAGQDYTSEIRCVQGIFRNGN
jgi:hypothetical protein